jgi:ABC-type glycerol-3-phosphate transport system permease component
MKNSTKKKPFNPFAIFIAVTLALYLISMCVPLFWTLMTTLKHVPEFEGNGLIGSVEVLEGNKLWWPKYGVTFENYVNAYKNFFVLVPSTKPGSLGIQYNILSQFVNSILYSVGCAITMTAASMIVAYATARFNYRTSSWIYAFVLVTMALPIVGSLPSELAVSRSLNIFDTFIGIWIMRGNFLNTYFLIFFAQFKMIPKDYTEAAKIDGASPWTVMTRVILPLASGTISTVFVLAFIGYWNDFQIPMVYLPSHPVAAYGMYYFQTSRGSALDYVPIQMAGVLIMALPIVIFYGIFNKKLNVNLSVGGIKG